MSLVTSNLKQHAADSRSGLRIVLTGRVQGLGVRPAIARLAMELGLTGAVRNSALGVEIVVEGKEERIRTFSARLLDAMPEGAAGVIRESSPVAAQGAATFAIDASGDDEPPATAVPVDLVTCTDCLAEVGDGGDRRFGYPLTSCAACGPRYSIIERMPYERSDTTMAQFTLCPTCEEEYTTPTDRRFHAQTNACPHCGPRVWLTDSRGECLARSYDAIPRAVAEIRNGRIVAVKGLGGYQLLVDATNESAVARLRNRKGRRAKPLAVLVASLAVAESFAFLSDAERRALSSSAGPIVVVPAKPQNGLASNLHPGLNSIGLMLPTTQLHYSLTKCCGPLVCTSGNKDGEPLVYEVSAAQREMTDVADFFLHHDRPIRRPLDDGVVRVIAGRAVTIRLARGLAPLPLQLPADDRFAGLLATGGHQKVAVALHNGKQVVLGPHLGDLDTLAARERFITQARDLTKLYRAPAHRFVHDSHPDYFTTRWATEAGARTMAVQHHHAHVVAAMCEHGLLDQTVLGVAWDGTGWGTDGTIWGGEFLLATATGFQRVARLRPFLLPGGEMAIREPWRVAVALVRDTFGRKAAARLHWQGRIPMERAAELVSVLDRAPFLTHTTSAGRLFDAVACLILPPELTHFGHAHFEGEPAMLLESACDVTVEDTYPLKFSEGHISELDWRPLIAALLDDRRRGVPVGVMAMKFHRALAEGIVRVCDQFPAHPTVLAGGVFQNRVLTELVADRLRSRRPQLYPPGLVPPNDGGLAAGQLACAMSQLNLERA